MRDIGVVETEDHREIGLAVGPALATTAPQKTRVKRDVNVTQEYQYVFGSAFPMLHSRLDKNEKN